MWGRDVPRRRIDNRQIGQRGLAGWVLSRQRLARRVLRGPLLAQIVGPAPKRRGVRPRPPFRPRLIAAPAPEMEFAPWSDALAATGLPVVTPHSVDDDQPASAEYTPRAGAYPGEHEDVEQPTARVSVSEEPPLPEVRATDIVPPTPQRALPPRERLGRRVEERVQELPPPAAAVLPPPDASVSEGGSAITPPSVEQPPPIAPEPYEAEMSSASRAANVVAPDAPEERAIPHVGAGEPERAQYGSIEEVGIEGAHAIGDAVPDGGSRLSSLPSLPGRQAGKPATTTAEDLPVPEPYLDGEDHPATETAPRDETIAPPAVQASAAPYETQGQPAPPKAEPSSPVRSVNEEHRALAARESSPAAPPTAEPPVIAEPPQSNASPDAPVVTSPAPLLSAPALSKPEETTAAELFTSGGMDRSPAAWMARLTAAAQPRSEQAPAPVPATPQAPIPPVSQGAPTPFVAPSPRFIAPMQVRTPFVGTVAAAETRANMHVQPDAGPLIESDAPMVAPVEGDVPAVAPVAASDAAPSQAATTEGDGETEPLRSVPVIPETRPDAEPVPDPVSSGEPDRSPAAWIERLRRAERAPANSEPARQSASPIPLGQPSPGAPARRAVARPPQVIPPVVAGEQRTPTPLPEATRRFLQPLVGIDPADVPVYEGPGADATTTAYGADALTDGNMVMLGASHAADSPETLGLIAHELTHVARRRDPRFIPPIARVEDRAVATNLFASAPAERGPEAIHPLADDETVARRVESRVAHAARAADPEPPRQPSAFVAGEDRPARPFAPAQPSVETQRGEPENSRWGGLPAPWEPLPGWLASPAPDARPMPANVTPLLAAAPALAPVAPLPQLAEQGRESDGDSAVSEPAPAPPRDSPAPAEPDLDALARQVYVLLKRRLALERRSFG
jgi:hypothetical protein